MTITEGVKKAYENAKSKGFHDPDSEVDFGTRVALIHSEVSEMLEADREGKEAKQLSTVKAIAEETVSGNRSSFGAAEFIAVFERFIKNTKQDEAADIVIRVFDMAGKYGWDLEGHIKLKMLYNSLRPHKHGKRY